MPLFDKVFNINLDTVSDMQIHPVWKYFLP